MEAEERVMRVMRSRVEEGTWLEEESKVGEGTGLEEEVRVEEGTGPEEEATVEEGKWLAEEAKAGMGKWLEEEARAGMDLTRLGWGCSSHPLTLTKCNCSLHRPILKRIRRVPAQERRPER